MSERTGNIRSALSRARGHGAARAGAEHWWQERYLAIFLLVLVPWGAYEIASHVGGGHQAVTAWLRSPVSATLMILLVAAGFRHGQLGLANVIRDYIKVAWLSLALVLVVRFGAAVLALASIVAVLKIAVGG